MENIDNPKISIVVPVYNVGEYIRDCLNSLVSQTLREIEIICIDDGSTDGSLGILMEYARDDARIKVITKENGGPASTRNMGIEMARGEYLMFVDSDDWMEVSTCKLAYDKAQAGNVDLVIFNLFFVYDDNYLRRINFTGKGTYKTSITYKQIKPLVLNWRISVYARLYRTEYLRSGNIRFPNGLLFEDCPFMMEALLKARSINVLHKNLYYHRKGVVGSIMWSSRTTEKCFDIFHIAQIIEDKLVGLGKYDEFRWDFFVFKLYHFTAWFLRTKITLKWKFLKHMLPRLLKKF